MKSKPTFKKPAIIIFWLLLWQVVAVAVRNPLLLPSPTETLDGLFRLARDPVYYLDIGATIFRCAAAILLSLFFGAVLSLASYKLAFVREALSLPVAFFKSAPIMAVAIYFIFLLTSGNVPILVCFIMCFPIVYTNLLQGFDSMDRKYTEAAGMYGLSAFMMTRFIYIPQLYPYFRSAMSLIAGLSWKAVVTAEVLSIPKFSLGYKLMNAKYYLNTDLLFAYVATIVAISIIFEKMIKLWLDKHDKRPYSGSKIIKHKIKKAEEKGSESRPDIRLENISKRFGDKIIFEDYSETLQGGKTTAIMAPSGTGKTTLMRILIGLEKPDAGTVYVGDLPEDKYMGRISVLFQEDRLLPWLNNFDNVAIAAKDADSERIGELLDSAGLANEKYQLPESLSGGMNHRVAICRTLVTDADIVTADEPFRGLDDATRDRIIEDIWKPETKDKTTLIITHERELAEEIADRIIAL